MTVTPLRPLDSPEDAGPWVLAPPFGAWLRHLTEATGLPWRVVALAAGVPTRTAERLLRGECRKIRQCDAQALLATRPADLLALGAVVTPAAPTTERVRLLVDAGVPRWWLARHAGIDEALVARIVVGSAETVSALTALTFVAMLEARDATLRARPTRAAAA